MIFFSLYSNLIKSPVSESEQAESDAASHREDPLLQNKECDVPACEEVPLLGHQEHDATHPEKDSSIQHQECCVPTEKEVPLVSPQDNEVPPQERDSLPQPQEHYQQFNMPPHEEVPLYQEYNAPPFEKDYFLQQREQYQTPVYQSSMHSFVSDAVYGPPVPSQHPYMLPVSQMFPPQPQPSGLHILVYLIMH